VRNYLNIQADDTPLLALSADVTCANDICNNPTVFPGLSMGTTEPIDLAPLLESNRNFLLLGEFGGALLIWTAPGVYDIHDFVLPEGRGKWAREAAQDVFAFAFHVLRARMIFATTPTDNRASRLFNRILGFTSEGVHTVTPYPGAAPTEMEYFVMERPSCQ
jgi:hypothetical protein